MSAKNKKYGAIPLSSNTFKFLTHDGTTKVNGCRIFVFSDGGEIQQIGYRRCRWCNSKYPYISTPARIQNRKLCPPCMEIDRTEKRRIWEYNNPQGKREGISLTDAKRKTTVIKSCWWCGKKTNSKSGYCPECFPIRYKFMQNYRDFNRDKHKERAKWRRSAQKHREKKRQYHKQWRLRNQEKIKRDRIKYWAENGDRINARNRERRRRTKAKLKDTTLKTK